MLLLARQKLWKTILEPLGKLFLILIFITAFVIITIAKHNLAPKGNYSFTFITLKISDM